MTVLTDRMKAEAAPVWSMAFRPFFLAAGLWSAVALALWIALYLSGAPWPSRFDPLSWHIHAMLFGFVPAAIAGFLLTAIANWTGRRPIQGAVLSGLAVLWLLGRIAVLVSALLPFWVAPAVDLAFPVILCVLAVREIVAARNWRNLMMPVPIAVLGLADLLMFLENGGVRIPEGLGWRLAIAAIIALVSAIGGRIIPTFTRNWLAKRGTGSLPARHRLVDSMALATLHTGVLGWAFLPTSKPIGVLLLFGAALNIWRLASWRGWRAMREPLLTILHLGYGWIILGAGLLGASMITPTIPLAAAVHAFTAGAMGTMILAVMTRVSRGHTGRPLEADSWTVLIYALVNAAAVARVIAPFTWAVSTALVVSSATLWVASFVLFLIAYGPMLVQPRRG
ncbi:MAG: NnrS family protein [Caulobacteraceae bacterium]